MRYLETDRKFYRDVVKIVLPVAMQSVITTGVNLVDTIMLGSLGETALSASSLANQFITLFTFLCMGVSMGASVLTSRFWGSQDLFSLKKVITVALRSGVLLALAFTAANVLFSRQIMSLYTQEQPVIDAGAEYLIWSTATFLLMGLSTVSTNIMRSVGLPHLPFIGAVSAFLINIGANWIFIFGKFGAPRMGVAGAAVGTVIARLVEFCIIVGYFLLADKHVCYRIKDLFSPCREMVGEFLRISVPVMLSDGLLGVGENVLAIIMGHIGSQFVSANAITLVVQRISTIFITGISFSSCFISGKTLGEGSVPRAQKQGNTFLILGLAIGAAAGGIIFLISGPMVGFYDRGTRDQGHRPAADGRPEPDRHPPLRQLHPDQGGAPGRGRHPVPGGGGHPHHGGASPSPWEPWRGWCSTCRRSGCSCCCTSTRSSRPCGACSA